VPADFEDGKDEGALRTIGELSAALGIKPHVLRYWEDQFPSLKPLKRSGARRYYRPHDVALVQEIDRLVNREGYTLRGARTALKDFQGEAGQAGAQPAPSAPQPRVAEPSDTPRVPADVVDRLQAIRSRLVAALEA
jgi:DNA-binding transcriptional MerR regulator